MKAARAYSLHTEFMSIDDIMLAIFLISRELQQHLGIQYYPLASLDQSFNRHGCNFAHGFCPTACQLHSYEIMHGLYYGKRKYY